MIQRFLKILSLCTFLFLAAALSFLIYIHIPHQPKEPKITIEEGLPLREIARRLQSQEIIKHAFPFLIDAKLTGQTKKLKAGDYDFSNKVSLDQVLNKLAKGEVILNKVQIIEGWTLQQIAAHLKSLDFIKDPNFSLEFLRLSKDVNFIQSLGLKAPALEGYLLPDTYYFSARAAPKDLYQTFVAAFKKFYEAALKELPAPPKLSQHQVITLASMIEKETGKEEERLLIASVFLNRLEKGMFLASDPTVIYGLKNFNGDLTKKDLDNPHPYNTYLHRGLPPGPICNPAQASILAVLKPAQTNYLYFVSKGDGTHYFSSTSQEHAAAVKKYQMERQAP